MDTGMRSENEKTVLRGSWTHSNEEDENDIRVYRPTDSFAFPPAQRGRETLVFHANGELIIEEAGPEEERPEERGPEKRGPGEHGPEGRLRGRPSVWTSMGENSVGLGGMPGAPERVVEIVESTSEVLRLRHP